MKRVIVGLLFSLFVTSLFSGCVTSIGNRDAQRGSATVGQQLVDLQKAKDAGAITEAEYQTQKAKLLDK